MDIITTIGPASWSDEIIRSHLALGVHCVRFPFSKETPPEHVERCKHLKQISTEMKTEILTMADFPGGKPRLSNPKPIFVDTSERYQIAFTLESRARASLFVDPPLTEKVLTAAHFATIGDGENQFIIDDVTSGIVVGRFKYSGELERRRAFLPLGSALTLASFTDRDKECARQAQKGGFDWIALSFVDSAEDVNGAREWLLSELDWRPKVVAKIETLGGVARSWEIATVADMIMIGRGDLSIQVGPERLWCAEKSILDTCRSTKVYSIVATGFLESLNEFPNPSRSECIDVCTALDWGANAIMLSAETTIGRRPVEAVKTLQRIFQGSKCEDFI